MLYVDQDLLYLTADHFKFVDNFLHNHTIEFWVLNPRAEDPRFDSSLHSHFAQKHLFDNRREHDRSRRYQVAPLNKLRLSTPPESLERAEIVFHATFITNLELEPGKWYLYMVRELA